MNIELMSDEQIIKYLAENIEKKRLSKKISSEDLALLGGHKAQTYSNFINKHTEIKIGTFIQILRALGELQGLQNLIEYKEPYSPLGNNTELKKRIRKTNKKSNKNIQWGDE